MTHGIARIRLDDGTPVWARISEPEELDEGGGFQDTGIGDRVISMAGGLTDVVRGVVGSLRAGLDPQAPVEVAVSFGIELSAQAGKVIGVLADGGGTASVSVSLTWTEPGPVPAPAPGPAATSTQAPPPAPGPAATSTQAPAPAPAPVPGLGSEPGTAGVPAPGPIPAQAGPGAAPDTAPPHPPAADGAV
ncbi:CU044_2847 family protein [Streptomyces sp. ISL-36]|uniref:CU044_2847 family protein n=1 Tax=Streptomyces sp. ISL-36 TaxID=2819182 RepID=UPI0027E42BBC|nr:CU044_2847 family protein [Streptomyces sp. ISL-36]